MYTTTEEQQRLVLENKGLVGHVMKKCKIAPSDYDDVYSIGTIGLIKAAISYDESKNAKFATYACKCITNEIYMYYRKNKKYEYTISFEEPIQGKEDENITIKDMLEDPGESVQDRISKDSDFIYVLNIILNLLNIKECIIFLYYMSEIKEDDIAKITNYSQSYVSRLIKRARNKIKEYYHNEEFKGYMGNKKIFKQNDWYILIFKLEDIEKLNEIYEIVLKKYNEDRKCVEPILKKGQVVIKIPIELQTFAYIASILQEIENV